MSTRLSRFVTVSDRATGSNANKPSGFSPTVCPNAYLLLELSICYGTLANQFTERCRSWQSSDTGKWSVLSSGGISCTTEYWNGTYLLAPGTASINSIGDWSWISGSAWPFTGCWNYFHPLGIRRNNCGKITDYRHKDPIDVAASAGNSPETLQLELTT